MPKQNSSPIHRQPPNNPASVESQRLSASSSTSFARGESSALLDHHATDADANTQHSTRPSGAIPPNTLNLMHQHTPQLATLPPSLSAATMPTPERIHASDMRSNYSVSPHGGHDAMSSATPTHVMFAPVSAALGLAPPAAAAAATTKYSRFEQLIKSLVGRSSKVSRADVVQSATNANANVTQTAAADIALAASPLSTPSSPNSTAANQPLLMPPSPEIRITKSPSEYSLIGGAAGGDMNGGGHGAMGGFVGQRAAHMSSTASLNAAVQQKLWSVVPLLSSTARRDAAGSCASLAAARGGLGGGSALMKKCETVLALSRSSSSHMQPMTVTAGGGNVQVRPLNRLRHSSSSTITCSRCSSLLSLAANGSRYSLNVSQGGGFVSIATAASDVGGGDVMDGASAPGSPLLTPNTLSALRWSRSNLLAATVPSYTATCKLCLGDVHSSKLSSIVHCGCVFCTEVNDIHNEEPCLRNGDEWIHRMVCTSYANN